MASQFQHDKLQAMFAAFDADSDGYLRADDFEALAARWGQLSGVEPGTELRARVEEVCRGWWRTLLAAADTNRDDTVNMSELLAVVDQLPTMREEVAATADTIFDAVDTDKDGRISPTEHQLLVETWHGQPLDTREIFPLLDHDGDGYLTRAEFATLWTQFWISDDAAEPGNQVCGRIPGQRSGSPASSPA
ncbi:EF-hand domain-containing protein [Streptomyces sp. NPDC057302]|uniref:EF-hand domain-containing protein n=1 Tax=Streptomyces sp. NPDC057302 TaxID=3346094 RepID=UPI00362A52CF